MYDGYMMIIIMVVMANWDLTKKNVEWYMI